jgi:hypothetical protein
MSGRVCLHDRQLRVPLRTRCQLLLTDIRRNPYSEWFRRDDWRALGDDYLNRLSSKQPMDLDAVQKRLDSGGYGEPFDVDAFAHDVGLIWRNGLDFNGENSFFGVMLKLLKETFDGRLARLKEAPCPIPAADAADAAGRKRRRQLLDECTALRAGAAVAMADAVQEACPNAVRRRDASGAKPEEVQVNLDKVDAASAAALLDTARVLRSGDL